MSKYVVVLEAPLTNAEGLHEICIMEFPSEREPYKWDVIELAKYQLAFKKYIPQQHVLIGEIKVKSFRLTHTVEIENKD